MAPTTVKVGMVGLGTAGSAHFRGYVSHPAAEVVAVCDVSEERAKSFAEEHEIEGVFTSYEEMIQTADIDAVDIATPPFMHVPMVLAAAKSGKHSLCEKPFSRSVGEGLEAWNAVCENGVKLVVGETYVFNTSHVKARELIEAGEIGRPLQIRQRLGPWIRRQARPRRQSGGMADNWRRDGTKMGGGKFPWMFGHAVHFFAAAEYFMLDQKIREIYSVTGTCESRRDPGEKVAEIPIVTWNYEDSDCQGVWMHADAANGKFDAIHGFFTQVIGDKGMIEVLGEGGHNLFWEGQQQHLVMHREGKDVACFRFDEGRDPVWSSDINYYGQGHINQVHHLIDCIVQDVHPRYNGEDGIHTIRCNLAAIRSAIENRPVRLEEIEESYTAVEE